jgi:hypothetical protein
MQLYYNVPIPAGIIENDKCRDTALAKFYLLDNDRQNIDLIETTIDDQTYTLRIVGGREPYFEWLAEDGDAEGDVFDEISVDPNIEIDRLKSTLKN